MSVLLAVRVEHALRKRLRTISSVLAAYRLGDFSVRARSRSGLLGEVLFELNQLGDTLRQHRLAELEAWVLLRKVLSEVDVVPGVPVTPGWSIVVPGSPTAEPAG